jgi:hypothetical protein
VGPLSQCSLRSFVNAMRASAGDIATAHDTVRKLRASSPSTSVALLAAEIDALSGDTATAAATVDAYEDSLDTAAERAHAAHVSALVTALSNPSLERCAAAIESAVQAQLDSVRVCFQSASGLCSHNVGSCCLVQCLGISCAELEP